MTLEDRIAALESTVARYEAYFKFGMSDDGRVPYVMTRGRFGVMTEFWSKQDWGKGAALSVGTICDRFGAYVEVEAAQPGIPAVAVYAAVPCVNQVQRNIALEAHASNSGIANIVLHADGAGIELAAGVSSWFIGKLGGLVKQLWP